MEARAPSVAVVGPITRDLIRVPGSPARTQAGGAVLFAASTVSIIVAYAASFSVFGSSPRGALTTGV